MILANELFAQRVRKMQVVAAALIGVVVIFAAIVLYLVDENGPQGNVPAPGDLPILSVVALVMLGISVLLSLVLPNMILRGTVQRIAAGAPHGDPACQRRKPAPAGTPDDHDRRLRSP